MLPSLGEGRRKKPGRHGDKAQTDHQNEEGKDTSADRDRVDVAVTHGSQGRDGPPKTLEDGGELLGLSSVLKVVYADRGKVEHETRRRTEEHQLLSDHHEGAVIALDGGIVAHELEQAKKAQKPEPPQ